MRRRMIVALLSLLALMTTLIPTDAAAANTVLIGAYYGNQGWKMDQVRDMEQWQGRQNAVLTLFTNWGGGRTVSNLFDSQLPAIWQNGNVPLVTWEPYVGANTPADIEARIARGDYDGYVDSWAGRMKGFLSGPDRAYGSADDRRAYLRLGHEMNGDWYPWGAAAGGNSPADYVAMWNRVRSRFAAQGIDSTRLQWVWSVNHEDVGGFPAEQFFPGDAAVDWIAIDGYNWGTTQSWSSWRSAADSFGPMIARLRAISARPLAITEVASVSTPEGVAGKSRWIADAFSYFSSQNVRMISWFNEDKEADWAVFGGSAGDGSIKIRRATYRTYAAYRSAVGAFGVSSDRANPRLLSDAQFAGQ